MQAICAVSTPLSEGALSVIRISGADALTIAEKIFRRADGGKVCDMAGYTCAYGNVVGSEGIIDDAVLTVFRAPRSYTGENTAEISCHGGVYVTKKILRLCCENGARPAQRGEFTKLAFLNGKMSLTQAEAVMDVITAQDELSLRSADRIKQGELFTRTENLRQRLIKLLGALAAWADYPEDDIPELSGEQLCETLTESVETVRRLLKNYDNGMLLKKGIPTAIAGKPNVGKSTLMNLLLGYQRAIVTDIAGTTRDVIEESVQLGSVTLRLSDTAGLRGGADRIESIGIELAKKRIADSALVIAVFDGSQPPDEEDIKLAEQLKASGQRVIFLINKVDISKEDNAHLYSELCRNDARINSGIDARINAGNDARINASIDAIEISAKTGAGRERLVQRIEEMFGAAGDDDSLLFINERQKDCLDRAEKRLTAALDALSGGMTIDAVTIDLTQAAEALSELIGESVTESVIEEVFSNFCVGK